MVSILTEPKNVFHLSEFSSKSENSNANNPSYKWSFFYTTSAPGLLLLIAAVSVQINVASMTDERDWEMNLK